MPHEVEYHTVPHLKGLTNGLEPSSKYHNLIGNPKRNYFWKIELICTWSQKSHSEKQKQF